MEFVNKFGMKKLIITAVLAVALIFFLFCPILSFGSGYNHLTGAIEYEGQNLFDLFDDEIYPTGVVIFYVLISALLTAGTLAATLLDKPRKGALFATTAWCILTLITSMIYGSSMEKSIDLGWGLWVAIILVIGGTVAEFMLQEDKQQQ